MSEQESVPTRVVVYYHDGDDEGAGHRTPEPEDGRLLKRCPVCRRPVIRARVETAQAPAAQA